MVHPKRTLAEQTGDHTLRPWELHCLDIFDILRNIAKQFSSWACVLLSHPSHSPHSVSTAWWGLRPADSQRPETNQGNLSAGKTSQNLGEKSYQSEAIDSKNEWLQHVTTNGCKLGDAMRCQSFAAKLVFLGSGYLLDAIGSLSSYGSQKFVMAASSSLENLPFFNSGCTLWRYRT